jgi:hypothetical protein
VIGKIRNMASDVKSQALCGSLRNFTPLKLSHKKTQKSQKLKSLRILSFFAANKSKDKHLSLPKKNFEVVSFFSRFEIDS